MQIQTILFTLLGTAAAQGLYSRSWFDEDDFAAGQLDIRDSYYGTLSIRDLLEEDQDLSIRDFLEQRLYIRGKASKAECKQYNDQINSLTKTYNQMKAAGATKDKKHAADMAGLWRQIESANKAAKAAGC